MALLNSRPHAVPVLPDKLADPRQAAEILGAFAPPDLGDAPDPAGTWPTREPAAERLERVRALRSDLMAVVEATDAEETARRWEALTARTSDHTFVLTFAGPTPGVRQVSGDPLTGRILASVAELVRDGNWSRIRVCGSDECRGVFYDTTRNRTQRWHSYELCGNRANVAAFRARKNPASTAAARPS